MNEDIIIRPWGDYCILGGGYGYQVKRITIKPDQAISLQSHEQRNEDWVIVNGIGHLELDLESKIVAPGNLIHINKGQRHRITNLQRELLVFIEVQTGTYLGEDDVKRFEDKYGRA